MHSTVAVFLTSLLRLGQWQTEWLRATQCMPAVLMCTDEAALNEHSSPFAFFCIAAAIRSLSLFDPSPAAFAFLHSPLSASPLLACHEQTLCGRRRCR